MSLICEHLFVKKDFRDPKYSLSEYDLRAELGLSIRKNLESGLYEIFSIETYEVVMKGSLEEVVDEANRREGQQDIKIGCCKTCPV